MQTIIKTFFLSILIIQSIAFSGPIQKFKDSAFVKAQSDGKKIVLHYYSEGNPTCKKQKALLTSFSADPKYKNIIFMQANYENDKDIKEKFGVNAEATLIYFRGTYEISRSQGQIDKETLTQELDQLASKNG